MLVGRTNKVDETVRDRREGKKKRGMEHKERGDTKLTQ
jgi:hypothetical protein